MINITPRSPNAAAAQPPSTGDAAPYLTGAASQQRKTTSATSRGAAIRSIGSAAAYPIRRSGWVAKTRSSIGVWMVPGEGLL
jgi:hypothetical protein